MIRCPPTGEGWVHDSLSGQCRRTRLDQYQKTNVCPDGNPVYASDGSKRQSEQDSFFLSLGAQIRVSRTQYTSSLVDYESKFGRGWFLDTWGRSLLFVRTAQGSNTILATRGGGQTYALRSNASSTWTTTPYDGLEFRASGNGWIGVDKNEGTVETYSATGALLSHAFKSGQLFTLIYSTATTPSNVAPSAGFLIEVTSNGDPVIGFTYDVYGRIASLSVRSILAATYGYDSARSDLMTGVQYRDGTSRGYLYEQSLNPRLALPSEQAIQAALDPGPSGGFISEADYRGPTPIADFAQMLAGRASISGITGIRDEMGQRYATYRYDNEGRVISEFHGASQANVSLAYQSPLSQTTVTDSLGTQSTRTYTNARGLLQLANQTQGAGSGCAASTSSQQYDNNGNVSLRDDFNGNRICYVSDPNRNLEAVRVEGLAGGAGAAGTACTSVTGTGAPVPAGSRKTSTQWHPDWRLATKTAEPGRISTSVYNGQPDPYSGNAIASCAPSTALLPDGKPIAVLCRQVEQATTDADGAQGFAAAPQATVAAREQRWAYNAVGQVLTHDGPRADVADITVNEYYPETLFTGNDPSAVGRTRGDLKQTISPAGHVTRYTLYDKLGQLLEMVDPNGVVTRHTYDARQRLTSTTVAGQATLFDYWPTGLLKRTTQPDQSWMHRDYDTAHRLIRVSDNLGNSIGYTLDNMGNRTAEDVRDPGNVLRRQLTRSIDALGRVQQITGRE